MATSPLVGPTAPDLMMMRIQDRLAILEQTAILPAGIVAWCATEVPDGWLVCDGSTISASRYGQLVARMGGTTLPNIRGRVVVGQATSGTFATMLAFGGAQTVTLTAAESGMPAHNTGAGTAHAHTIAAAFSTLGYGWSTTGGSSGFLNIGSEPTSSESSHTHPVSAVAASSAHENMPPYVVLLPIIKI